MILKANEGKAAKVMRPMGKADAAALFDVVKVVHHEASGKVSQAWLSACAAERTLTEGMMGRVAAPSNLLRAYRKVVGNGGSSGVDGMDVRALKGWLRSNLEMLTQQLLTGSYCPQAVRKVEIPKPNGGKRMLGIPTVIDRFVQQAISQALQPGYEEVFSEMSFGFRPGRNAHHALAQAGAYVASGKHYVVDMDLEKFFDEVNHDRLMWLLSRRIGDKRLLKLIRLYLQSGIMEGGIVSQRTKGTPQGSPLSPLLSNIVLDELDKELERRGLNYVRYADDVKVFVRSQAAAHKVKAKLTKYITERLRLKVNEAKSRVCFGHELNFLGHSLLKDGSVGLSASSEMRLKGKVKQITRRNRGVNLAEMLKELHKVLQGWLQYFRYARMTKKLETLDGWIRRRLRCVRLKQCKRTIGIVRWLRSLGMEEKRCWLLALSGKGWWRMSNTPASNEAMNKEWFTHQGYYSLSANYQRYHLNKTAVCV